MAGRGKVLRRRVGCEWRTGNYTERPRGQIEIEGEDLIGAEALGIHVLAGAIKRHSSSGGQETGAR